MKRRLSCFTSPLFVVPETAGKYEKWSLIPDRLHQIDPGEVMFNFRCPTPVSHTRLCYAHDETYVNQFLDGTLDEKIMRRIGLQWSRTLVESTLMFNGATVDAALSLFEEDEPKQSACLAGGSHHAHPVQRLSIGSICRERVESRPRGGRKHRPVPRPVLRQEP